MNKKRSATGTDSDLWHQGAYLVHDISTPIATLHLNIRVLAEYLPTLVDHYGERNGKASPSISKETLGALRDLAESMQQNVATLQRRTQAFSHQLQLRDPRESDLAVPTSAMGDMSSVMEARSISRILVIEDEEIQQLVAEKQLSSLCEVEVASNGDEAIQKWKSDDYDLVLLDFMLPGMSSLEILEAIAATGARLPVVVGFTNLPEIPEEYSRAAIPISAYLSKPFKLETFRDLLKHLNLHLAGQTQT